MTKQSTLSIFIGDREKAVHQALSGVYPTKTPQGKDLRVLFEVKDDQPTFQGVITNVTIETTGDITPEEASAVMQGLAKEMRNRTGAAAMFYLKHFNPELQNVASQPLSCPVTVQGFAANAKNNLDAIKQVCEKLYGKRCSQ